MAVAPIPVMSLHSVVLPVVGAITPVLYHQVMPVGAVFMAVPVMVITVVPVVYPDLNGGALRSRCGHDCIRRKNGGSQDE